MNSMERLLKKVTLHTHRPKRAETRSFPSKAAGNEDPDVYWTSTLKGWSDRERSWGPFSAALEQAELQFLCFRKRNRILLGEAGVAVLFALSWRGVQHAFEAQIGEAVGRYVLFNFLQVVA